MRFDHYCTISRPDIEDVPTDDFGNPVDAPDRVMLYKGRCQVYDDETVLKRMVSGDQSLIGRSAVRLQLRPQAAPLQGDDIEAVFNGARRTGEVEAVSSLAHYPRLLVRWL